MENVVGGGNAPASMCDWNNGIWWEYLLRISISRRFALTRNSPRDNRNLIIIRDSRIILILVT